MKYLKLILLFFVLLSINYYSSAKDAEKLEVEFEQTKRIQIKGISKFAIVDPTIAKVELSGDTVNITGIKFGNTSLFIWKNNEIIPYIIYSVAPKNIVKYNNNQIVYSVDYTQPYGYYNLFSGITQSGNNSNQSLIHQLYYRTPFFNGFFTFNGNFNNSFTDIKNLQSLDINNLQLSFNNKDIYLTVGDVYNQLGSSLSQLRGIPLKGGSFQYTGFRTNLSIFGGIESLPFNIYNKDAIFKSSNNISGGLYGSIVPLDNLFISTNYTLRLKNGINPEPNIVGTIRWSPLSSLYIGTDLGTDFNGKVAYNVNSSFYHGWQKTKEYIRVNALINHFDKNYSNTYFTDRSTYLSNIFFQHRTGLNLSASLGRFIQSNITTDNISLRGAKVFEKYYNVFSEIAYNNSAEDTSARLSVGTEILNFIPINLNYSYAQGLRGGLFNENFLSGSVNLFENDNARSTLSTSIRHNNSNFKTDNITSLFANFNLGLYYSGIKKVNLSTVLSYGRYIPDLKTNSVSNYYSLSLSGSWDMSIYNRISASVAINKDDINNVNVYSNVGYTYNFGKAIDDAYTVGNIKGVVFEDTNYNNIYDSNEKIMSNVKLKIGDKNIKTDSNGYLISGIDYGAYEVIIDKDSLPEGFKTTSNIIETVNLNSKVSEYNIPVRYESVIKGYIYAGKETGRGLPEIKILIDDKGSIITDSEGYFYINVIPGKHILKLDYTTIPSGYTFNQSLTKEVETGKEDTEINFVFSPVRILTIQAYETNSLNNRYSEGMKVVKDLEVKITYPDGRKETMKTDEDGLISLEDLEMGTIEISSKYLPEIIKIEVPEDKFQRNIEIPVLVK